ncbi:MAG: hypothetical protein KBT14_00665 [Proteobacteria bacterium]|nr:hypothetical protein [Candidatus Enterousia onthequi]
MDKDKKLSEQQIEQFNEIRKEILRRFNRVKAYSQFDPNVFPVSARAYSEISEVLEPLVDVLRQIDLEKSYDDKKLENFLLGWNNSANVFSKHYDKLHAKGVLYEDVWDGLNELDRGITNFMHGLGVFQEYQEKKEFLTEQDKNKKKLEFEKEKTQESDPVQKYEKVIAELRHIDEMVDRQHSDESFKKMMFGLKELRDKKLLPDRYVEAYRAIFNETKKCRNTENGILRLSSEINWQIQEMLDIDSKKQKFDDATKAVLDKGQRKNKFFEEMFDRNKIKGQDL